MSERDLKPNITPIVILAVIMAAGALGLGLYNSFAPAASTAGTDGEDGDDGDTGDDGDRAPGYYCSSGAEVQNAIDTIGTGSGTIYITEDIILSSTILVDQGGEYIIQGDGAITVDCGGDRSAFNITNVEICTLRDIKIIRQVNSNESFLFINDTNNNPVYIQNVHIKARIGKGVIIDSDNVWIQNCYMIGLDKGIILKSNSELCHILDNTLKAIKICGILIYQAYHITVRGNYITDFYGDTGASQAIKINLGEHNIISGNTIKNASNASFIDMISLRYCHNNIVSDNVIRDIEGVQARGIKIYSSHNNSIIGNTIADIKSQDSLVNGIFCSASLSNIINSNMIAKISSSSAVVGGHGIEITQSYSITVGDNLVDDVSASNGDCSGIHLSLAKYSTISGNAVDNINPDDDGFGVLVEGADNNTIMGNTMNDINPGGSGYGAYFDTDADFNIVIGNLAYDTKTSGFADADGWATNVFEHNIG